MKKLGLIGYPLSHSFSKKFFAEKFEKEKLADYSYENFEIENIKAFPALLKNNPDLIGLNITIPYKEEILSFIDQKDEIVKEIGACNTIKIMDGKLKAYNTDVIGFEKSFLEKIGPHHKKALILGTGGASKSVAYVLDKLGINYKFVSRNPQNLKTINYRHIDGEWMNEYQIIINTTPLGSFPKIENYPKIPYEFVNEQHYFFDLIYNPSETVFLKKARERGALTVNGLKMLELQAEASWRIWTDKN